MKIHADLIPEIGRKKCNIDKSKYKKERKKVAFLTSHFHPKNLTFLKNYTFSSLKRCLFKGIKTKNLTLSGPRGFSFEVPSVLKTLKIFL